MSSPGAPSSAPNHRQKRMGPAPFASFEDLSDELDSPEDKHAAGSVVRLPGIREDATPSTPAHLDQPHPELIYTGISLVGAPVTPINTNTVGPPPTPPSTTISSLSTPQESQASTKMSLQTPSTPRIDISRASSSSHHDDSRDSTPERELFEGHDQSGAKLGLAFKEEGTLDLRSSTEELDFQDPQEKAKAQKARVQSPCLQEDSLHQRKDSQSSEIGLLSISGRTSRLSSIGSQGSSHSRISNVSHLSIISGQSGRSPSPHKMLLETSFCGYKPPVSGQQCAGQSGTKIDSDVLEKVLLSRQHDPREAILAEGISMEVKLKEQTVANDKTIKKVQKQVTNVKSDITIKVDKPPPNDNNNLQQPKLPKTFISPSGVEYTYIPLKGPLPKDDTKSVTCSKSQTQTKTIEIGNNGRSKSASSSPAVQKSKLPLITSSAHTDEPVYIRIKLKPDHMYDKDDRVTDNQDIKKPVCLDLKESSKKPFQSFTQIVSETSVETANSNIRNVDNQNKHFSSTPNASPRTTRHKILKDTNVGSKTPSPSLSRRSSFTSLFKSRETIVSPESPTVPGLKRKNTISGIIKDAGENIREKTRSRSKSRDRDKSSLSTAPSSTESIDSKSKQQKSVLSIFKPKRSSTKSKSGTEASSPEVLSNLDGIANVQFKFNTDANLPNKKYYETPLHGESIRIPLHSPTHYEDRSLLQELKSSSQDSQETVIDTTKHVDAVVETMPIDSESNIDTQSSKLDKNKYQSNVTNENIVFSTKLGSKEDLFTTKLLKEKQTKKSTSDSKTSMNQVSSCQNNFESTKDKNYVLTEKSITLNGILQKTKEDRPMMSKTESLNFIKDTVEKEKELAKDNLTKDLKEGSKSLRNSFMNSIANEDRYSSESEKDSELDYLKVKKQAEGKEEIENIEPERKGLVHQQDSYEEELPYVPTTLPLERSVAVPIVPVKQRGTFEMKTYPIDRPRSTTPINLSTLEDYCEDVIGSVNPENITKAIEKLKISLPRDESVDRSVKTKSPRRPTTNTSWFTFADKSLPKRSSPTQENETSPPPPLPPKGVQKEWINFEEIPERRKPPRRIQTIPSRSNIEVSESILQENIVYSYVNPEDCKCECHEIAREREQQARQEETVRIQEDEVPLLDEDPGEEEKSTQEIVDRIKVDIVTSDRRSIISGSSIDLSTSLEHPETSDLDPSLRTPFTGDLGISSNRSSIISQDEPQSPDISTPNAFPKTS